MNFLLDENVDPDLRTTLHRKHPEMVVWIIGDPGTPQRGTLDPEILVWCEEYYFVLVTNNRSSMPGHLHNHLACGQHVPGILLLSPAMSMGEAASELILI